MNFAGCYGIPAAAWQQLRGVKWPRLKKANFGACLARERKLVEGVFVFFHSVYRVLYVQYLSWQDSSSSESMSAFFGKLLYDLTLDQHCRCFTNQGEGAADLLETLGHSQELEVAQFDWCQKIPAAAWHCVPSGAWPKLRYLAGFPDEEERLRSNEGGWPRCWDTISRTMQERQHFDSWQLLKKTSGRISRKH